MTVKAQESVIATRSTLIMGDNIKVCEIDCRPTAWEICKHCKHEIRRNSPWEVNDVLEKEIVVQ